MGRPGKDDPSLPLRVLKRPPCLFRTRNLSAKITVPSNKRNLSPHQSWKALNPDLSLSSDVCGQIYPSTVEFWTNSSVIDAWSIALEPGHLNDYNYDQGWHSATPD